MRGWSLVSAGLHPYILDTGICSAVFGTNTTRKCWNTFLEFLSVYLFHVPYNLKQNIFKCTCNICLIMFGQILFWWYTFVNLRSGIPLGVSITLWTLFQTSHVLVMSLSQYHLGHFPNRISGLRGWCSLGTTGLKWVSLGVKCE